ncbi:MAG TPA: glycosyltransferase family 4 protein [Gemmatimonadales bacterium]|nr:glycosyltransferase family 4 protein [Gemmatimonadales bacterium]
MTERVASRPLGGGRRRVVRSSASRRNPGRSGALRVLMITSEWPEPGSARPTQFIRRQAEFLKAAGVELDVFAFRGGKKPWNYLKAWSRVRPRLRSGQYDLVHAQFGQSGLLAFPRQLPLVVTFRGCDLLGTFGDRLGRPTARGRLLQTFSRFVARRADAVIIVSEHMRRQFKTRAPVHVIPSGLDLKLFRPYPQREARQELGLDQEARLVLFVASPRDTRKRYGLAKRAVELLNERLPAKLIVGWGIPHEKIPLYMSAANVLVVTSIEEGSPNVVKEALACNLPVVSVAVGDVPERLKGVAGTEVCADDRPQTIASALERVLRRRERVDGRSAVRSLDEHLLTRRVIDIYRSVIRRSKGSCA